MIPIIKENKLVHKLRNNIYIETKFCIQKIFKKSIDKDCNTYYTTKHQNNTDYNLPCM